MTASPPSPLANTGGMAGLSTFPPGAVIAGRYELAELLGRGGNGAVYRAVQRPLGHEVALKMMLLDALTGESAVERFRREAALVQGLEHPNTVRLYEFGTTELGVPFIVFELLRGRTLEDEIAKGPMPALRVGRVASQVLKSLMEAHAKGIVHRDVKPSNILLLDYSGESDFVKVLDFGVARPIVATAPRDMITHAGQIIGTPSYMAPEQVHEGAIAPATDLYALGLVMAEALTGKRVYGDGSPIQIWMQQTSPDPVPLAPTVTSSAFGAVIARATRKKPAERYASAAEMLADVERAVMMCTSPTDALARPIAATSPMEPPIAPAPTLAAPPPGAFRSSSPSGPPPTPMQAAGWQSYGPPPNAVTGAPIAAPGVVGRSSSASNMPPSSAAAPASSRALFWVAMAAIGLLLVIVIIVVAGAGGALLALRRPAPNPIPTTTGTTLSPQTGDPLVVPASGRLKTVTAARIEQRLRANGYKITVNQTMAQLGFSAALFTVQKGITSSMIQLYDYESPQIAASAADALRQSGTAGVIERDGGRILYVAVLQKPLAESRALFDEITAP